MSDTTLHLTSFVCLGLLAIVWGMMLLGALFGGRDRRFVLGREAEEGADGLELPKLSILIPARDEAGIIGAAVSSALAQDYPELELIVMDDNSTDGTGQEALEAAAGDRRLTLLTGAPLPDAGWKGKPWALHQAQGHATGELLLFVDADVKLDPLAARRAVEALLTRELDLLSLWGLWIMDGFWVRVALPVVGGFVRGAHPLDKVNDPSSDAVFANGQFILMPRTSYDAIGGHTSVADEVLEDVRLAQVVKAAGAKGGMFLAPELFAVRLYTNLPDLWRGTVKNFYAGMGREPVVAFAAFAFVFVTGLLPSLALVAALASGQWLLAGVAGMTVGFMWAFRLLQDRSIGVPPLYALTHPLGATILLSVIASSALRGMRGRATAWKGRPV